MSLVLEPGTVTAVVGPSGSGKSTLVRLIARFWDVESGAVRVGGTDVRDATSADLLSHLGLVLQDGGVITDTVRANIALGVLSTEVRCEVGG
ncbi:ATP-binding cassette domain-containing protein [Actinomyces radicidentis]|uniref:ATP-binding cassette domain-containing protein n=1 Tax=Actinomyces radicidentis TaxID=111015 RepID=UPI001F0175C4|nr:ATP-binding cassette domain-containing protein [Actinomyces radicidentis]